MPLTFGKKILEKKHLIYICTDFLKFVVAKFKLNLTFVQLFILFELTKNKNLYNLYNDYQTLAWLVRVFTNSPGDLGSIPGWVIPKTLKMILDISLLNTQHYKVQIKGKVGESRERTSTLPYTSV